MSSPPPPPGPLPAADFRPLFEAAPDLLVVLDASDDYRFVAASDAYLESIMTGREAIMGRPVFEVFPDDPDDPAAASHVALRAVLGRVRAGGAAETLPVYQYNIRRAEAAGGGTEERHWQTSVFPVFADGGTARGGAGQPVRYLLIRTENVTRQVVSDRAADDARSRLEATLGAAEIGTWIWEVGPDRVTADRNLARMFNVTDAEANGGPLEAYTRHVHEEDLPRVQAAIEEAAREGRRFDTEYRIRQHDGTVRWVVARGWVERDAAGQPVRFPGVLIDITERKRAVSALRDSDERLRMAIDQTGLGTFDYDVPADRLTWSEGCRQMFGVAPGATVTYADTFAKALHPDDLPRTLAAVAEATRPGGQGFYDIEYRIHRLDDGQERWIAARGKTAFDEDGQPHRFIGTVLDITERKREETAAQRRTEQLQQLAAISARLNAAHDVASVLGIVTEEARALIGAQQAVASVAAAPDPGSQAVTVVSHVDKDLPEAGELPPGLASGLADDLQGPVRVTRAEAERQPTLRASGVEGPAGGWLAAPLVGRNTRRVGIIQLLDKLSSDDFTGDDEALLAQLAQIATVAIENARLYEELRRKDQRKDEFLAMLAHELRNPLAAIRNAVALGSDPTDAAEIEWAMEVINRQMRHLSRLIDDLLDVSRITQGKVQLRREPLDAASVLHAAVENVRPLMEERQHELTVALRPGTLGLEADPTRLEQIVVNLLSNAAKYTEKGGEISLRARKEDEEIVIRVRDNGAGIAPEKMPQMFELFAQGDRTLARSEGGLGVGLTLVRSLTEMHGGRVEAFSDGLGRGSEFVVRLPASAVLPLTASVETPPVLTGGSTPRPPTPSPTVARRVLVVDDNVDSARGTSLILSHQGHDVRLAYDGLSAVAAAQEYRPEFVLLDIGLPGLDGYEVARRLRQDENLRGLTLIAVSGYGQESDRRLSQEAGFDQHLVKPVDPGVLLGFLR